jgi:ubiquinone biosynthesis protein COQ4
MEMPFVQFEPVRALRAARAVAADPDDLPQVFTIIEALSGTTLSRITRRMCADDTGARLLSARPDIVELLADREALGRLPAGSLGRAYLEFVERENISAAGIREAAVKGTERASKLPPALDWTYARLRDTHDLWHAATGYSGDVLGETALLAFTFAQTWNPAIALIVVIGISKTFTTPGRGAADRRTILDGFRRGLAA